MNRAHSSPVELHSVPRNVIALIGSLNSTEALLGKHLAASDYSSFVGVTFPRGYARPDKPVVRERTICTCERVPARRAIRGSVFLRRPEKSRRARRDAPRSAAVYCFLNSPAGPRWPSTAGWIKPAVYRDRLSPRHPALLGSGSTAGSRRIDVELSSPISLPGSR